MKKLRAILLIASAVLAAAFTPLPKRLCITKSDGSGPVQVFAGKTDSFAISYTHSVNKGRVRDYYTLAAGGILRLERTAFVSYGAGMPEPFGEQIFTVTDDTIEISNINLELKELVLQTGLTADHHIEAGGKSVVLNGLIPPQTRIVISVKRISYFELLNSMYIKGRRSDS